MGPVVFHVLSKRIDGLSSNDLVPQNDVIRIWPETNKTTNLESLPTMGNNELYALSHWMEAVLQNPRVKYGGDFIRGPASI